MSVLGGIRADVLGALLFVPSVDVHLHRIVLVVVAVSSAVAAYLWGRSARRLLRASRRIERHVASGGANEESLFIARASFSKDLHTAILYGVVGFSALLTAVVNNDLLDLPFVLVLIPVAMSIRDARRFLSAARLSEQRTELERRAEEVLEQEELAPRRWAERLAPAKLPAIEGYEVGQVYKPGTGAMAGDFYDLYPTGRSRLAAVIGDVTGHGIEPSITAFQVKYLLRVFLRQFRDPAQAVEELNSLITEQAPSEELVSLCVVVFDELAGTLRFASAGHPPAWLWHDGQVQPLRSTGPLLSLDPRAIYASREVPMDPGDVLLLYTDGLTEARSGEQLFGEDRVAQILRRDPGQDAETLCKTLLEAASDFATTPLSDDVALLAIRRT